ncbi:hypothetical protein VPH35_140553 [Triticum aestivum]|uniref:Uncharacterized protein n=1 Tax=Aegilops tauschii TaxID=37682 RepID=M8B1X6_AEGTA
MDALEVRYGHYVLLATAVGYGEEKVTPVALLATLEKRCGVLPSEVVIEVACPPHDLWLTFSMEEKCTDVLFSSMKIKCCRRWLQFSRWSKMVVKVELPEPKVINKPPESMDEYEAMQLELGDYGPSSPRKKKTLLYPVLCRMKEVVDRGPLLTEDLPAE